MGKPNCTLKLTGHKEILKDIERIGGSVPGIASKAILKSGEVATEEFLKVIEQHRYAGVTEDSLKKNLEVVDKGNKLTLQTGFDVEKGGLAAIFLDKGTPKQKPVKYISKIKRNKKVKEALESTLESEWSKLL